MSYEEFAADLTSPHRVRFHSAEESEQAVRELGVAGYELRQLGRGTSRVDMAAIQTSKGFLSSRRFERSAYSPLRAPKEHVLLLLAGTVGGDIVASGDIVPQGGLIVQTPESQVDFIIPDLTASEGIGVPESRFYAVAMDHGFSHLARFSRTYREAFGEMPSETLSAVARNRAR